MTENVLIALISALLGGFLGNFLSYRLKKRTGVVPKKWTRAKRQNCYT